MLLGHLTGDFVIVMPVADHLFGVEIGEFAVGVAE
jgi:hypothetical protein